MGRHHSQRVSNRDCDPVFNELSSMGVCDALRPFFMEPNGPDAEWIKRLSGYTEACESAIRATVWLYSRTGAARVGHGKHGPEFSWELGQFLVGQGFISETQSASSSGLTAVMPDTMTEVIDIGVNVQGTGTVKKVGQKLHNAEKLTDPKPWLLRDLNYVRTTIAIFWVSDHLWLMKDETIADWFNRRCRQIVLPNGAKLHDTGIQRTAVSNIVDELGLKKHHRSLVRYINKQNQVVWEPVARSESP